MAEVSAETELRAAHKMWRHTRERAEYARNDLNAAIAHAVESGMSQSQVAEMLGWPRQRVNKIVAERS